MNCPNGNPTCSFCRRVRLRQHAWYIAAVACGIAALGFAIAARWS